MVRRIFARLFALAAIAACAGAAYVVAKPLWHKHHHSTDAIAPLTSTTGSSSKSKHHLHTKYTVQPGDTLSQIAEKHHVTVAQLKRLNPSLRNGGTLVVGHRIRLRTSTTSTSSSTK